MKYRTLLLTSALMLAIAGAAAAQMADTTKPVPDATATLATSNSETSVSGTVVSSTSTELVINSDAGQRMTFVLDPKILPAASFTVGGRVTVQYHTSSSGNVYQSSTVALAPQAKVETPAKVEPQANDATTPVSPRLPKTASNLPLIGLLGLLAMGGAVVVRVARS